MCQRTAILSELARTAPEMWQFLRRWRRDRAESVDLKRPEGAGPELTGVRRGGSDRVLDTVVLATGCRRVAPGV